MIKTVLSIFVAVSIFFAAVVPGVVYAAPSSKNAVCDGIGGCTNGGAEVDKIIALAVDILSIIAGIIGVVMLIVAGIKYITSQGDSGQVKSAKSALIYAVVGLVVATLAQTIAHFVLSRTDKIV